MIALNVTASTTSISCVVVCPQVLAYMHAQNAHFHQGYDLFSDIEPYMKQVASQVKHWTAQHWQCNIITPASLCRPV